MQINKKNPEKKESGIVSSLLFRYAPYWPLFVLFILAGLTAAWMYVRYATPLYNIYATILVEDEKKGAEESKVLEALNIPASKKIVENEIEVIHSRKLMKEVVNQLHLYAPVYEEGAIKTASAYTSSPVVVQAKNPEMLPAAQRSEHISFVVKGDKQVIINNKTYPMHRWVSTPYGELRFGLNPKRTKLASDDLFFRLHHPKDIVSALLNNLSVTASGKLSTIINLTLKDEVPERGEDVLNKLIAIYDQSSVDDKNKLAVNTLAFVENRLYSVQKELDSLERHIQQFRARNGLVNLGEQGKLYLQNVGTNDRKAADMNMQLAVLDQVERYVVSKKNRPGIVPATLGINDPVLAQLMQKLYDAEVEYEKLKKTTADKNPMVVTVAREIEQVRPHILENLHNQRRSLQAGINNLSASNGMYEAMLRSFPQKERELAEISRQQKIKDEAFQFLLEKREQITLSISSTAADSKIVDAAESSIGPVSPNKGFVYLLALVLLVGLAMGVIALKELFNRNVLFRSDIDSFTGIPVASEIFYNRKEESLLDTGSKTSFTADQFRQLRGAIDLCNDNVYHKWVLVTSGTSGEGKTYISTNLAISLALSGKKVVLIDLNVPDPKASFLMGMRGKPGITEFLKGTKDIDDIILKTGYTNLFVIGAGSETDDVPELLLNGRLKDIHAALNTAFDFIVIDTSPVDRVSDAYSFSRYCDVTLFVVRHGHTPKTLVQSLDGNHNIKALKNLSIVFNGIKPRGIFNGRYGYGYGYGNMSLYPLKSGTEKKKLLKTPSAVQEVKTHDYAPLPSFK